MQAYPIPVGALSPNRDVGERREQDAEASPARIAARRRSHIQSNLYLHHV